MLADQVCKCLFRIVSLQQLGYFDWFGRLIQCGTSRGYLNTSDCGQ
jgi:hypothetical protein